ncbi:hypothetical protein [Kamptonema sp. UHCC 0994]|uniref:hypothetical protein n=1 Tax=Kamptonema sp. UHCC 0994 TaxID=3031329 RepID=UPI0023B8E1D6|nr:hypothetical protein [Kamptonema sp. UHCC 0994]MDF0552471.1 hypothetical protein [Kamptonema sp. UHCC 0994]
MKKSHLLFLGTLTSMAIVVSSCQNTSKESLLDIAANFAIEKYQKASCEEVAQMQPQSQSTTGSQTDAGKKADLQAKAIEMLQKDPEMREKFINRVAGPIANKMFECNLIP